MYLKSVRRLSMAAIILAAVIQCLLSSSAMAQGTIGNPEAKSSVEPVSLEAYSSYSQIAPGKELYVAIKITVGPGWHINSHTPNEDFLIPTDVALAEGAPATISKIVYPDPKNVKFEFSPDVPLSVYDDHAWIKIILSIPANAKHGATTIPIEVTTQACDNKSCVAPATQTLNIPVEIGAAFTQPELRHADLFKEFVSGTTSTPADTTATANQNKSTDKSLSVPLSSAPQGEESFWGMMKHFKADAFVARYGYALAFIAMYLLGLGLTLTPCVYPIIPITIGYFGTQAAGKMSRQFMMALVFGLGIAISYAIVGTIAAFSGSLMGAALQSQWVLVALSLLCVIMGFNAFGAFEITLPAWLSNAAGGGSKQGLTGAALMGLTMGIAAAPCLAAFIVSLLAFVGQKGDPILGFSMFFVLGLGLATPFIALGTFSGLVSKAPKSGAWMIYAKKLMGALLFAAALYFLNPVLPKPLHHSLVIVSLTAAGLYFGFFEPTKGRTWIFKAVRYFFAVLFIGLAIWWGMPEENAANVSGAAWQTYSEQALDQAKADGKPAIVDVFADWCLPCKELDKFSFSDPRVIAASKGIVMLKADITSGGSPESKKIIARYGLKGVPTVIFIKPDGEEILDLRINQFEKADAVLARFNKLLESK